MRATAHCLTVRGEPIGSIGFSKTFNYEPVPPREVPFVDSMPDSYYQIPKGECVEGKINLHAPGWNLSWSGTILGRRDLWKLDFGYEF